MVGDDGRDRLAHEADSVGGEQRTGDGRVEASRHRLEAEIGGGVDGDDTRHRLRLVDVDRRDRAVGDRRPDVVDDRRASERHVPVDPQIVDVPAAVGDEPGVFHAKYPGTEDAADHLFLLVRPAGL